MFRNFLLVGAGGAAGSMLRYAIAVALPRTERDFPWATLTVNLIGCFLIGLLAGCMPKSQWLQQAGWMLLATGLCGGFTTFSAFALDNVKLFNADSGATAFSYIAASIVCGTALCFAGYILAAR